MVTIVGEGEPILYQGLGELIQGVHQLTEQPVAVITNGSLLADSQVQEEISQADIVLPSLDAYDEASYRRINRPHHSLHFTDVYQGLVDFSHKYQGQLWLEIMLIDQLNDTPSAIDAFGALIKNVAYDRLYLNTPVRPPAEGNVRRSSSTTLEKAVGQLGGICIDQLAEGDFSSDNPDDYQAILDIITRHPMNQHEVKSFLTRHPDADLLGLLSRLKQDPAVQHIDYMGFTTFRIKQPSESSPQSQQATN